jgi:protein-disulfide isomerase
MAAEYQPPRLTLAVGARDHAQGPAAAGVVLVEYGDYQCPYCGAAYPVIKRVQKELASDLRFVFRNFPLTNAHPYAEWAAEVAEAAAAQGKFWEVHDYLYEHQAALGDDAFFGRFQKQFGLDELRLRREVAEHVHLSRIREDFTSGVRSGVNGTPTFYIDGVRYDGPAEFEPMVAALRHSGQRTRSK